MDPALLIACYVIFVYSTVCHEAAHAWVAHKLGDDTAYLGGQVSLDPIPHIKREPVGMVAVPLLTLFWGGGLFGWASAPLDPMWVARHPKRSALVAIAGPLTNLLLCALAAIAIFIGAKNGVFAPADRPWFDQFVIGKTGTGWTIVAQVLSVILFLNLLLAVLNFMPVPPLDGSNIPLFFLNDRAADTYQQWIRQPIMLLISIVFLFKVFPAIFTPVYIKTVVFCYAWFF